MLLETKFQIIVMWVGLVVFGFVSPLLNIIYLPKLTKLGMARWKIRIVLLMMYLVLLALIYWSLFIIYN